ncbi:hypothetical protein [Streptomyces sp. NBC_00690]|uniref:hypothetical protein n=1 Tax=Streptomyces sp. NBC_00690 TaxID=2975808 RepID=UPI002E2DA5C6|nr:hypothetical protein [Streptomyces sp. NBC_00690]
MTGHPAPAFGLSFDPRALTDLLAAPGDIRDLALAQLQDVVTAQVFGGKLVGDLAGFRKLYVDHRAAWRVVYAQRPAPPGSAHRAEIHVVAVRPRARQDAYDTARARLGVTRRPMSALAHAARTRSPQLPSPQGRRPRPGPHTSAGTKASANMPRLRMPDPPRPAPTPTSKGPAR